MTVPDRELDRPEDESSPAPEGTPSDVVEAEHQRAPLTETNSVWAALAAYFAPPPPRPSVQPESSPWLEDDVSAEHGYEPGFEGRSEFFTWLYRIALNRALNVRRDRRRRITMSLDDPRLTMALAVDSGGDPRRAAGPLSIGTRGRGIRAIRRAIAGNT